MGFFRDFTLSPYEKQQKAKLKVLDKRYEIERQKFLVILPEVKKASIELFELSIASDQNWKTTLDAQNQFKEVALKANSSEDLVIAAVSHALCTIKYVFTLNLNSNQSTFENLKFHWWQILDDLEKIYLVGRFINLNPDSLKDVIECIISIDAEISRLCVDLEGYEDWVESHNSAISNYSAVPKI